jgi:hypothetical protein
MAARVRKAGLTEGFGLQALGLRLGAELNAMPGAKNTKPGANPGLCAECEYGRVVSSSRASEFWHCDRSLTDASFAKYPRLPVLVCRGYDSRATREV